jgi:hypothetical protein
MTHDDIAQAAADWLHIPFQKIPLLETELANSWTEKRLRVDVLGWVPKGNSFYIIEAKASRTDFLRGKEKFGRYREWCDLFYIATPQGLIDPRELDKGIGLLEVREVNDRLVVHCHRRASTCRMGDDKRMLMVGRANQKLLTVYEKHRLSDRATWHSEHDYCLPNSLSHYRWKEEECGRVVAREKERTIYSGSICA